MSSATERTKRDLIIERDKGECYLCSAIMADTHVVLDHIIPKSRGGTHAMNNLAVACRDCDARKGDHLLSELKWVSNEVKAKYATLAPERTHKKALNPYREQLEIFLKRVYLAALVIMIARSSRLDSLIDIAKRK